MATQIPRDRVIGNFKLTRGLRAKHKNSSWREDRNGMSDEHCAAVRKAPCCGCLKLPAGTIHHLKGAGERGMAVRAPDKYGVPLCARCHDEIERAGTKREFETFQAWGIRDVHALAGALWGAACDVPKMIKIVIANKGIDP